jgi:hypothetical protein
MMITTGATTVNRGSSTKVHLRSIARHELSGQASPPAAAAAIRGDTLMAPAN